MYSLSQAAEALNIKPTALRRLIRKSSGWNNAGLGGRYSFTEADLIALSKLIKTKAPVEDDQPGISLELMKKAQRDRGARLQQLNLRRERQARLTELRKAAGV